MRPANYSNFLTQFMGAQLFSKSVCETRSIVWTSLQLIGVLSHMMCAKMSFSTVITPPVYLKMIKQLTLERTLSYKS